VGATRLYRARLSHAFVKFLPAWSTQSLKGLFQPKAITAAMIKISTNSRRRGFMSKIVRKNDQSNPLRKVGECLYRNRHGVYFGWFSVRGKQLKRSLKTSDKELARRRLAELRKVAVRLHGLEDRNLRFEDMAYLFFVRLRDLCCAEKVSQKGKSSA